MEIDRLQLVLISILAALFEGCQTYEHSTHILARRGLADNSIPASTISVTDSQVTTFTNGAQRRATSTDGAQPVTAPSGGFLNSVSGWLSSVAAPPAPSPEELARQKAAQLQREKEERQRRHVDSIRQVVFRIPGVRLADTITRKTASAIGLGLGFGAGKAQTIINNVYDSLRAAGEEHASKAHS